MVVVIIAIIWVGIGYLSKEMVRSELPELPEMQRRTPAVQQQLTEADAAARSSPRSGEAVGGLAMAYHANSFFHHARIAYTLAMRVDADEPRYPYLLGVLEMTTGQNERAITFLGQAMEQDPGNPHGWARLGQIHYRRTEPKEAERAFRRALDLDPTHPHAGVGMARVLGLRGAWEEAAKALEPCVDAHPGYGPGHRMLALVYQELGRTADQKYHEDLGSDIGLQMDDTIVHDLYALSSTGSVLVTQSQIARSWGNMERAIRLVRRAVEVAPEDKDVRLAAGRFLSTPGIATPELLSEARANLEVGLTLDSTYVNTRHDYAVVLEALGDSAAAARQWERILREEPEHSMAWMSLGEQRFLRGDYADAREYFLRGLAIPPDTPFSLGDPARGYRRLALCNWRLGRGREAFDAYSRSVEHNPLLVQTYVEWAKLLRENRQIDGAVTIYDRGVRNLPRDANLRRSYGNFLLETGRLDGARTQLTAALELEPGDVRILTALGYIELESGNVDQAIAHLETSLRLNESFPATHYYLGNALARKGRVGEAIRRFEALLRIDPQHDRARRALERLRAN
jgi:tetratricopeptide (TPR) repeat protein